MEQVIWVALDLDLDLDPPPCAPHTYSPQENSIPVPTHITVSREGLPEGVTDPPGFAEDPDWVQMGSTRIAKPFVEKPVSGEDHNVYIYYPSSMVGGGDKGRGGSNNVCINRHYPSSTVRGGRGGSLMAGTFSGDRRHYVSYGQVYHGTGGQKRC